MMITCRRYRVLYKGYEQIDIDVGSFAIMVADKNVLRSNKNAILRNSVMTLVSLLSQCEFGHRHSNGSSTL